MECLFPVDGFRQADGTVRMLGERADSAVLRAGGIVVPCGRCRCCRLEHSRQWAVRMMHEAQTVDSASFITLTYDQAHLPVDGNLDVSHIQKFWKRLRKRLNKRISYYACGEYGDLHGRPHWHAAVFGEDFTRDREDLRPTRSGFAQWTSPTLEAAWQKQGRVAAMELTFESAQYVAKYVRQKRTGPEAEAHYNGRRPEFSTMSKRPAIGHAWFVEYIRDVYPRDEVVVRGTRGKPPKYYDQLAERLDPVAMAAIKERRQAAFRTKSDQNRVQELTRKRRLAKAEFQEYRAARFAREVDSE